MKLKLGLLVAALAIWQTSEGSCYDESKRCFHYSRPGCDSEDAYTGEVAWTASGRRCQNWKDQSPHKHTTDYNKSSKNYCRKYDGAGAPGPWCYTLDPNSRYESCFTDCASPCYDAVRNCFKYGRYDCYGENAYTGTASKTAFGKQCLDWKKLPSKPYLEKYMGEKNYCRNPNKSRGPWCYTDFNGLKRNICFFDCGDRCYDENRNCFHYNRYDCLHPGAYSGTYHHTVAWTVCQQWYRQTPHKIPHKYLAPNNYCIMSYGDVKAPWCYTTDPKKEWDYCFPDCKYFNN